MHLTCEVKQSSPLCKGYAITYSPLLPTDSEGLVRRSPRFPWSSTERSTVCLGSGRVPHMLL